MTSTIRLKSQKLKSRNNVERCTLDFVERFTGSGNASKRSTKFN